MLNILKESSENTVGNRIDKNKATQFYLALIQVALAML